MNDISLCTPFQQSFGILLRIHTQFYTINHKQYFTSSSFVILQTCLNWLTLTETVRCCQYAAANNLKYIRYLWYITMISSFYQVYLKKICNTNLLKQVKCVIIQIRPGLHITINLICFLIELKCILIMISLIYVVLNTYQS